MIDMIGGALCIALFSGWFAFTAIITERISRPILDKMTDAERLKVTLQTEQVRRMTGME